MKDARSIILHGVFVLTLASAGVAFGAWPVPDPVADPGAVIVAGKARFTVLTPSLVRLEWSPDGEFEDRASQVVIHRRLPVPKFESRTEKSGNITIETDRIKLYYNPDAAEDGRFSKESLKVRMRIGAGGAEEYWEASPPFEQCENLGGTIRTLDGISGACPLDRGLLNRYGWTFLDDSKTLVFDPGEEDSAAGDRGTQSRATVLHGDGPRQWVVPRRSGGAFDGYLLVYGNDYRRALKEFALIAGPVPLPPRYAFGAWWSRYWAYSDAELRELVGEFREHNVPLDVLVIDMDWHLDGWTGYTWNPDYFPDPEGFLKWCREEGLKVTLNLHPADGVGKHEKAFPEMCAAMGLDPEKTDRIPFDCASRDFVDAYFKHLHHPIEKQGVDFWWMDWQQGTDTKIAGLDPLWWLNRLHWRDMERRAGETGRRPLIFSRWGGLGNHRYQIGFSGDTFCNWPSLAFQPYFTATASNVLYGYWSHDIGGHQPGPVEPELYARWIQWGAFSPILRTHTTKNPLAERRIWKFPAAYFDAARQAFQLRYRLIPYIYTMARKCYDEALPLCRPLYYEWPDLEEAYARKNQYLFGDDLMVAPVTEAADPSSGCAMVEAWIPPGRWIGWFTGQAIEGPKVMPLVVPIDEAPIFVREGAIIPTMEPGLRGGERLADPLEMRIFPSASSERTIYEDDNLSAGYLHGACAWTRVAQRWENGERVVTIDPPKGAYAGMRRTRGYVVKLYDLSPMISRISLDGRMLNVKSGPDPDETRPYWWYDAATMGPSIHVPPRETDRPVTIVIDEPETLAASRAAINGFRGMARAKCRINELMNNVALGNTFDCEKQDWVFSLHEGSPDVIIEKWKDNWGMVQQGMAGFPLEPENIRRAMLRMMGLFYRLDLAPALQSAADETVLTARLRIEPTWPIDTMRGIQCRVSIQADEKWKIEGEAARQFDALPPGTAADMTVVLKSRGPLSTSLINTELVFEGQELVVHVPIQKLLLPSINAWHVAGPFDAPFDVGLDRRFPPEEKVDLKAVYQGLGKDKGDVSWKLVRRPKAAGGDMTDEFFMDFDDVFGGRVYEAVAYAAAYLESPEELSASLALGSDDGAAVWLNGVEVFRKQIGRPYSSRQDRIPVTLKKGRNELLVKVSQGGGDWGLCVHVETPDGKPLPQVRCVESP